MVFIFAWLHLCRIRCVYRIISLYALDLLCAATVQHKFCTFIAESDGKAQSWQPSLSCSNY